MLILDRLAALDRVVAVASRRPPPAEFLRLDADSADVGLIVAADELTVGRYAPRFDSPFPEAGAVASWLSAGARRP